MTKDEFIQKNSKVLIDNLEKTDVLRILRNLCIEKENQIELNNSNILYEMLEILKNEEIENETQNLILQVFGNSIQNCDENKNFFIKNENELLNILSKILQKTKKRSSISIISMFLYNLKFNFQNNHHILNEFLDKLYNKKKQSDTATKFICLIFEENLKENLNDYFEYLRKGNHFERVVNLLEILDEYLKKFDPEYENEKTNDFENFFKICFETIEYFYRDDKLYKFIEFECLFITLEFLSNLSTFHLKNEKLKKNLILNLLKIIKFSDQKINLSGEDQKNLNRNILKSTNLLIEKDEENKDNTFMYYGYKTNLIRSLGNFSFKNKSIQNLLRQEGFIPIVLSHCSIEQDNPFLKEWSIFCIRNLCDENEENQKEIEKYKPIDIDPATRSLLNKMGEDIEIVDDKIKIKKVDL
eukprot:gene7194-11510_t